MRVLYDHQTFTGMAYGGVSRYFSELMQSFAHRSDIDVDLALRLSNNEYLNEHPVGSRTFRRPVHFRRFARSMTANRIASALNRLNSIGRLRAGQFDVFHPTYYHRYFLPYVGKKPVVVTFHDATSERYGHIYPDVGEGLTDTKRVLLERADAIISVSEFSKQEILHYFDVDPARIQVVHLGSAFGQHQPDKPADSLPFAYLLYVGKRELYKNFTGFFRAIQPLLHRHRDLHLVCAGGGGFSASEQALFHAAGLTQRVHYQPINDAILYGLYHHARAFVFPSLNEGFGIPVLEAFGAGCPVVLSDRSSLPEVAGDAAVYFDPENDEAIADAIERVIMSESLRDQLRRRGTERLGLFSLDKTAQQTFDVYQQLT